MSDIREYFKPHSPQMLPDIFVLLSRFCLYIFHFECDVRTGIESVKERNAKFSLSSLNYKNDIIINKKFRSQLIFVKFIPMRLQIFGVL